MLESLIENNEIDIEDGRPLLQVTWDEQLPYQMLYVIGQWISDQGFYDVAIGYFHASLALSTEYGTAAYYLGQTYLAMKKYNDAGEAFDYASKLTPDYIYSYFEAALAYDKAGDEDRFVSRCQSGFDASEKKSTSFELMLYFDLIDRRFEEIIKLTDEGLTKRLRTSAVLLTRAVALAETERIADAEVILNSLSPSSRKRRHKLVNRLKQILQSEIF